MRFSLFSYKDLKISEQFNVTHDSFLSQRVAYPIFIVLLQLYLYTKHFV